MMRRVAYVLVLLIGAIGCGESPSTAPPAGDPADPLRAVVAGLVTDSEGDPVPWADVLISEACVVEPDSGCFETSYTTDSDGEFWAEFEPLQGSHTVRMSVAVVPPLGKGYVLGQATIEDLIVQFRPPPVTDVYLHIVLPPNTVDSRQPVRVQPGNHRHSDLRGDAERFYLSAPGGGASAIDPVTGQWLWQAGGFTPAGGLGPEYALMGDRVVIAGPPIPYPSLAGLVLVEASDGEVVWIRDAVPHQTIAVSPPDGLYASEFGVVMAFDPQTGGTRWTRDLIGSGHAALAASAELVCSEILAYVECWEPATGERVWARPTEFGSWLAIAGDVVILGSQSGWTAMDARTGDTLWEASIGSGSPPIVSPDEERAFACVDSACFAIRTDDGGLVWRTTFEDPVSAPAVEGGSLYVRVGEASGSSIHALDAASGQIQERILPDPFDYGFCGEPAVTSNYLAIFGCGSFYVFRRYG